MTRERAQAAEHRMQQTADLMCARFARSIELGRS
jgi:hypothetical protein